MVKGARTWREIPPPSGEKVVSILDATITTDKEHRLCVRTARGSVYLWRRSYRPPGRLDPDGTHSDQYWHLLKPLPDGQSIKHLVISEFDSDEERPLVAVKGENGQTYAWQNSNWHPLKEIADGSIKWPHAWPSSGDSTPQLLLETNSIVTTNHPVPSDGANKPRREFHSWFTLPKPPGKVIDEAKASFEGSLSDWLSSYVLLEDGRLFVLATERDVADGIIVLASVAIAFLVGVILLIILGIRRKRADARRSEAFKTSC